MKKLIAILLCLLTVFALFSCDKTEVEPDEQTENAPENETAKNENNTPTTSPENELAKQFYAMALNNEIRVYETDGGEYHYLRDCRTPYNRIPLLQCNDLEYAYTDLDGDSVQEVVIDCGDTMILRYYEGTVYVYSFTFRNLYYLKTDGSYAWNDTGENFEYGEDKLYFEGAECKSKELYRIVNDGEPNAEYYIDGKQVTREEILKYIEDNPKTEIEFSPLDTSAWCISEEKALEIASTYWEAMDGFVDYGAGHMWIYQIVVLNPPTVGRDYYHIGWQIDDYCRDDNGLHYLSSSTLYRQVFVNIVTGECYDYEPYFGKG